MSTFLKIVRYFFAIIFIFLILILFLVGIPLSATTQTFVNRDNVKDILTSSTIYDSLGQTFIESISTTQATQDADVLIALQQDPTFAHNIETIITSDETKAKVNTVIDSFYDWFEGKTSSPEFEIYLIDDENTFKDIYVSIVSSQLENLPTCSTSSYNTASDILEADCIPPYIDSSEIKSILEDSLNSSDIDTEELMDNFKFSSDQLNISEINSLMVQNVFIILKFLPIILIGLIVLLSILVVLLIPGVKGGLITISIIYILNGLLFLITTVLGKSTQIVNSVINMVNIDIPYKEATSIITSVLTPIFTQIMALMQLYSLGVIGVGVVLLIIGLVIKKKKKEEVKVQDVKPDEKATQSKSEDTV